ncbi:MAG: hypothetical protein H0W02_23455, partial [Ktedonobacteraceae bacterium]|nr:hypothetical protein [Ktedonobacteraceae bacterium]
MTDTISPREVIIYIDGNNREPFPEFVFVPGCQERSSHMRDYRTIDDITEEYLRNHPDEIDVFITELFEEYAQDADTATLLSSSLLWRLHDQFHKFPDCDRIIAYHKPCDRKRECQYP